MTDILDLKSFDELAPTNVNVIVTLPEGREVRVPLRTLTYWEIFQIEAKVPPPVPPVSHATKEGPVFDYKAPAYLQALQLADIERSYRRVLAALRIDVPGATEDEKLATLKARLDAGVMRQLNQVLMSSAMTGEARIEARAATFPGHGAGGNQDVPRPRVEPL